MHPEFKQLLLDTIAQLKDHPDAQQGVAFVTGFEEEPDWEVAIVFKRKIVEQ